MRWRGGGEAAGFSEGLASLGPSTILRMVPLPSKSRGGIASALALGLFLLRELDRDERRVFMVHPASTASPPPSVPSAPR